MHLGASQPAISWRSHRIYQRNRSASRSSGHAWFDTCRLCLNCTTHQCINPKVSAGASYAPCPAVCALTLLYWTVHFHAAFQLHQDSTTCSNPILLGQYGNCSSSRCHTQPADLSVEGVPRAATQSSKAPLQRRSSGLWMLAVHMPCMQCIHCLAGQENLLNPSTGVKELTVDVRMPMQQHARICAQCQLHSILENKTDSTTTS